MSKKKPYEILNLKQGSQEWLDARYNHITASQVASLMGYCPYTSREELLQQKLTRTEKELTEFQKNLFQRGHDAEFECRTWCEAQFKASFSPLVVVSKDLPFLMASLDGFNLDTNTIFEAKFMGEKSLSDVELGKIKTHHMIQIQAQLLVSGADHCLYFCTDGKGKACSLTIWPDKFYMDSISEEASFFWTYALNRKGDLINV